MKISIIFLYIIENGLAFLKKNAAPSFGYVFSSNLRACELARVVTKACRADFIDSELARLVENRAFDKKFKTI